MLNAHIGCGRVIFRSRYACVKGKMYKAYIIFISIRCRFLKCGLCSVNIEKIAYAKRAHVLNKSPAQRKITRRSFKLWLMHQWKMTSVERHVCEARTLFCHIAVKRFSTMSNLIHILLRASCGDPSHFSRLLKCFWNFYVYTHTAWYRLERSASKKY